MPPAVSADDLSKKLRKLPPPFLDDCDRPACDDMVSKMKSAAAAASASSSSMSSQAIQQDKGQNQESKTRTTATNTAVECPPRSSELGTATWTLLHTMAAWFPDRPSEQDQSQMRQFFSSFARFYPCPWCALDFQENLEQKPVETSSRKDLCLWLCEQHNIVNKKLGKPVFTCDMELLDERWRKSSKEECQSPKTPYDPKKFHH